jgi:cell division protein FtsB
MKAFSARSFWLPVLLATLIGAFFGAALGQRGRHLAMMMAERSVLSAELARLQAENERLRAQRDELLSSPAAIERVAREEYGFLAPGESASEVASEPARLPDAAAQEEPLSFGEKVMMGSDLHLLVPVLTFLISSAAFAAFNLISAARESRQP